MTATDRISSTTNILLQELLARDFSSSLIERIMPLVTTVFSANYVTVIFRNELFFDVAKTPETYRMKLEEPMVHLDFIQTCIIEHSLMDVLDKMNVLNKTYSSMDSLNATNQATPTGNPRVNEQILFPICAFGRYTGLIGIARHNGSGDSFSQHEITTAEFLFPLLSESCEKTYSSSEITKSADWKKNPAGGFSVDFDLFKGQYGISEPELEIYRGIYEGKSLQVLSKELGKSEPDLRVLLTKIFRKTGGRSAKKPVFP